MQGHRGSQVVRLKTQRHPGTSTYGLPGCLRKLLISEPRTQLLEKQAVELDGEIAPWFGAHTVLAEDSSPIPSMQLPVISAPGVSNALASVVIWALVCTLVAEYWFNSAKLCCICLVM